jgi:hypothetical protein
MPGPAHDEGGSLLGRLEEHAARAIVDDTTVFMVGGPADVPYTVSRWEASLP